MQLRVQLLLRGLAPPRKTQTQHLYTYTCISVDMGRYVVVYHATRVSSWQTLLKGTLHACVSSAYTSASCLANDLLFLVVATAWQCNESVACSDRTVKGQNRSLKQLSGTHSRKAHVYATCQSSLLSGHGTNTLTAKPTQPLSMPYINIPRHDVVNTSIAEMRHCRYGIVMRVSRVWLAGKGYTT